jgi:hypothetical protein
VDSADTEPQQDAPEQQTADAPRWFQRVLPVTGLVIAVIALAALAVPAFRDQVKLSVSRQPQPYVELYFARSVGPVAQVVCQRRGSAVGVRFVVASHLERSQAVAYRVSVDPASKGRRTLRKAGSAHTFPNKPTEVRKVFALPRGTAYTVSVTLPALDQQLRAHCSGRR